MIHFHKVQKSVGKRQIFVDLTLFLPKASYTLLSGAQQSGKTTLLQMIMAYERPDQGTLQVDGIDIGSISHRRIPYLRRQIGLIAHTPALLEDRTVSENISVPLQLTGFDREVITDRLHSMLEVTGLHAEHNTKVNNLSASQRQLISAARATIHKPSIVVADEPLKGLDTKTANTIVDLLNKVSESGATILVAGQNLSGFSQARGHVTKALKLERGSIKQNDFEQETVT